MNGCRSLPGECLLLGSILSEEEKYFNAIKGKVIPKRRVLQSKRATTKRRPRPFPKNLESNRICKKRKI
jgi:hypothetical protein